MKKKSQIIILIIVLICAIGAIYVNIQNSGQNHLIKTDINTGYNEEINDKGEENMNIFEITSENFEKEVLNSEKIVIIDFWAEWCGPCQAMSPIIEEVADENPNLKICKVNIDNEPSLASEYGVTAIPTLVIIKEGKVTNTLMGVKSKEAIVEATK